MDVGTLLQILLTTALSGLAALAAVPVELRWLRRDVDAAHERLDKLNAPSAYTARWGARDAG